MRFSNVTVIPGDHAPFLETRGNSVRLVRSGSKVLEMELSGKRVRPKRRYLDVVKEDMKKAVVREDDT